MADTTVSWDQINMILQQKMRQIEINVNHENSDSDCKKNDANDHRAAGRIQANTDYLQLVQLTAKMTAFSDRIRNRTQVRQQKPQSENVQSVGSGSTGLSRLLKYQRAKDLQNPFVIVVGIENYSQSHFDNLDGVAWDIKNMIKLWSKVYHYCDIETLSNSNKNKNEKGDKILKDRQEFEDYLRIIRGKIDANKRNDGLLFIYSGHGIKDAIILANGIKFKLCKIFEIFNGKECVFLRDKPKVFILDCCRGKNIAETYKKIENNNNFGQNIMSAQVPIQRQKGPPPAWVHERFHPNSGFATIFGNCENYACNESDKGGSLIRSIQKIFENPKEIEKYSLRELIIAIRKQTKLLTGSGHGTQCVDFHESLEYKVYFKVNQFNFDNL